MMVGTSGDDAILLDSGSCNGTVSIVGVECINAGDGNDVVNLTSATLGYGNVILNGGNGADILWANAGDDLLMGGAGTDQLDGGAGCDIFQGGAGNDTITTGSGADIIAFNRGGGSDSVLASQGADNTISLGGGIKYTDLNFRKSGYDLQLGAGGDDAITLKGWYASTANHSVVTLQMIEEAAADFSAGGSDPLRDNKVECFNFAGLASKFDQARAANPYLTSWALTNALSDFHLSGSDSAALGGDLAYQYGKNGNLSNVGLTAAQSILSDPAFGTVAQALKPLASLQEGALRLG
jgi:Ca2+-binding RTX toxin-like protein